jgi:hypothetical protein
MEGKIAIFWGVILENPKVWIRFVTDNRELCEILSTMRQIVIFLVLICNYAVGQIPNDYDYPLAKRLKGVSRVINKNRTNSKWIESFDSSGYMIESISYYRRKIRSHVKFEYKFEGNNLSIVSSYSDVEKFITEYYFGENEVTIDSLVRYSAKDSVPFEKCDSFSYQNGRLMAFRFTQSARIGWFKFDYDSLGRLKFINDEKSGSNRTFIYDINGHLLQRITKGHEVSGSFIGVPIWSKDERNKYCEVYEDFDKKGNWRKMNYLTSTKKIPGIKRKIKYNK